MSEKYFVLLGFSFQVAISEMKITEFDKRLNFSYFINESFYVNSLLSNTCIKNKIEIVQIFCR